MEFCPKCSAVLDRNSHCPTCGLQPTGAQRRMAALGYLWITGLVFLFLRRFHGDRYVRFHSLQAVLYGLAAVVVEALLATGGLLLDPFGSTVLAYATMWSLLRMALFLTWILVLVKAYQGFEYKLPGIGEVAWKYSPSVS